SSPTTCWRDGHPPAPVSGRRGAAAPVIGEVDKCRPTPRLFKDMGRKTGGASMAKMGPRLGVLAAFLVTLAACGGSNTPAAQSDVGITSNSILLGNTIAQSGPARAYGTIANAENAYFTYVNNTKGGVNGRMIKFKILDDAYTPANAVTLTKQLVEQDQVFAMFSGLGTQTQTSVRDYLNTQKVPQLFVATGATTFMADYSSHNWTIGWQPPYQGEARIYAKDILANHASAKIGVLYQNDDYGQDYLKGLTEKAGVALGNVTSVGYIKHPTDPQWASDDGMKLYKTVIANCTTCNVMDGFNIYGVAVAYTMVDILTQAGSVMTRKNVMDIAA